MFRQGDVFVKKSDISVNGMKELDRENGRVVLAHGEVTGHVHAFSDPNVKVFLANDNSNRRFVVIEGKPTTLFHEEHAPIEVPPGVYEVVIQREWSDNNEPVKVLD